MATILVERVGSVGVVTISRPERLNAMSWPMVFEMREAIAELNGDTDVRAIVLTGEGRAFCAGTDMSDLQQMGGERREDRRGFSDYNPGANSPWEIAHIGKAVIAAVNGAAVGLGVELATQCDLRIASTTARFGWVFTQRGIVPDTGAGTYLLPHIVGLSTALKWTISGRLIPAEEALAGGFVEEICQPEDLMNRSLDLARGLAQSAPLAVRETKRLIYAGFARTAQEHVVDTSATLGRLFQTEDHREGITSFLEKRPAAFRGK